jgi:hypothetical protein
VQTESATAPPRGIDRVPALAQRVEIAKCRPHTLAELARELASRNAGPVAEHSGEQVEAVDPPLWWNDRHEANKYDIGCPILRYPAEHTELGEPMTGGPNEMPDDVMVELARFRLAKGVTEDEMLNASDAIQHDFLQQQPGFLHRELLHDANGQWVDLLTWKDEASVASAMRVVSTSAACQSYFRLMVHDGESPADVLHLRRARRY